MTIPPLLRFSYWFDANPPPFPVVTDRIVLATFGVLLVAGIALRIVTLRQGFEKMKRRLLVRIAGALTVLGAFGLVLYALAYERIPVLSARLGFLVWFGFLAWYAWKIVKFVRVEIPAVQKRREEREQLDKWIPKPNK